VQTQTTTYRLRNWREYNASLVGRGSLTLWIEEDIAQWWLCQDKSGKPGASHTYSNRAGETCLSLRLLLKLALRQSEGFVRSLLKLAGVALPVPDYSTMCRRQKQLPVSLPVHPRQEARHILLDSTGLKVFGEGEWKVKKHGQGKRRLWKKIHLSVDEATGEVLAVLVTQAEAAEGAQLPELVLQSQQIGGAVAQASADGAFDTWANDAFLSQQGITATIPPRKGSKIRQHGNCRKAPLQRDQNLRTLRRLGRRGWAKESGYSRRSLVETHMMRQKRILGSGLSSRCATRQAVECRLRCLVLNRLTHLGMPQSYPVSVAKIG
jgi:hypothetical protein